MILKPHIEDLQLISFYLGKVTIGLALAMAIPLVFAVILGEFSPAYDFLISTELALLIGVLLTFNKSTLTTLSWMHGMIVVSLSWLLATLIGAIPLYLSGHWLSYLDACFDAMSGFATTGLTLVTDVDHLSYAHNLWRHLMMFIGGQGIVIIAVSLFVSGLSGAFTMYVGEGREEKIFPNVAHTGRFIWLVSLVFLCLGTFALTVCGICEGMEPFRAFFHGLCIFMAAFDTGGFSPQSQNILYYHSVAFELITVVIMIIGAMNFKLHYHLWTANVSEITKDIETRTFFFSVLITFFIVAMGLVNQGVFTKPALLFRKGFYQLISGHTGTGYQTVYAKEFVKQWGDLASIGVLAAMTLGGAICSTTGAIKMARLGIIWKALVQDIKRIIFPERAIIVQKFHHVKEIFLEDKLVRSALMITMAYFLLYCLGALIGMFYGYGFLESLFESVSAAANVGLSCGITSPNMPVGLKLTYIIQMWAGRLEFMSVFTLVGFVYAAIRGK